MKLLLFQARRFAWTPFERTLPDAEETPTPDEARDAVIVFVHAETTDASDRTKVVRKAAKNIKWLAGKRGLKSVVLHSFTHLGGETAEPGLARELIPEIQERLEHVDYQVLCTPFGWVCEWELSVYGEGLAKVYKAI